MANKLFSLLCIICLVFVFIGCQPQYIEVTHNGMIKHEGVTYEVIPYSPTVHEQFQYDSLFSELDLSTAFVVRISNYNEYPVQTFINDTFILQDRLNRQYKPIDDPFLYIRDLLKKNMYSDYSYHDLRDTELQVQHLMNQSLTTYNVDYVESQLSGLQDRVYLMEQNQLFQEELNRREKSIRNKLKMYGFKDQIIYPQGINQGLVIFPPVPRELLDSAVLYYMLPGETLASVSIRVKIN